MYPGNLDASKPEVGRGLNKPAMVTLKHVFKRDRATGQPVTDHVRQQAYAAYLKKVTTDLGADFVSYDPGTGVWRFCVEHFGRYAKSL